MAKLSKDEVHFVMQHANWDAKLATPWLKQHKGQLGEAVADARADAQLERVNAGPVTMQDVINLSI